MRPSSPLCCFRRSSSDSTMGLATLEGGQKQERRSGWAGWLGG